MLDFHNTYPDTVFKFQNNNTLGIKALTYGELFFCHLNDLNDPYDTKSPFFFKKDNQKIKNLIVHFMKTDNQVRNCFLPLMEQIDLRRIVSMISSDDLLMDELIDIIDSKEFEDTVNSTFSELKVPESLGLSIIFRKHLKKHIQKWLGSSAYIISFSKNWNNPVMWSHYANQHKGFCLCFNIQDNKLISKKASVSNGLQNEYEINEVDYKYSTVYADAYLGFPGNPSGDKISKKEIDTYRKNILNSHLTKFESWRYEDEVRLVHINSMPFVDSNGIKILEPNKRIFYYDQKQLTGLIYGARMNKQDRDDITSIIRDNRQQVLTENNYLPLFIFYDSKESQKDFFMHQNPLFGLDSLNRAFNLKDYDSEYKRYRELKDYFDKQQINK